jgi:hypothetical protein
MTYFAEWEAVECYKFDMIDHRHLLKGHKAVGRKWAYKIKWDNLVNIAKYPAQIVAQGSSQRPGIDYSETFAPVSKIKSIHLFHVIDACNSVAIAAIPHNLYNCI